MKKKFSIFTLLIVATLLALWTFRHEKTPPTSSIITLNIDLSHYSTLEIIEMIESGKEMLYWKEILSKTGSNIVRDLLHEKEFYERDHYPQGDVRSSTQKSVYYYHAHRPDEHGHFHTFLKVEGGYSHVVAISMDHWGEPIALFTTNNWVTKESWKPAEKIVDHLSNWEMDHSFPSWPANRWLTHFFSFFKPVIATLLIERDAFVAQNGGESIFSNRALEILSYRSISFENQMNALQNELLKREQFNLMK